MMVNWNDEINELASKVLSASNPVCVYRSSKEVVQKYKPIVLLFDGKLANNLQFLKYENEKFIIKNIYNINNIAILNYETSFLSAEETQAFAIAQIIALDSNIISLLPNYFNNKSDDNLRSLINFLIESKANITSSPYILEDSLNSTGMKNGEKVYNSLLYYSILRRLTDGIFFNSTYALPNDFVDADEMFHMMNSGRKNNINFEKRAKSIYCFLMKTYIIGFGSRKSPKSKIEELIDFFNTELGVYFESGTVLAYLYFENKNDIVRKFFQKIMPTTNDYLKKIEGMAWDLFHLWDMPTEMAISSHNRTIFVQSLATGDKALANLIDVNPIDRIFMFEGEAIAKYRYNINFFIDDKEIKSRIISNGGK